MDTSLIIHPRYFQEANFRNSSKKKIVQQDRYPSSLIITTIAVCTTSDCVGRTGIQQGTIGDPHIVREVCKAAGHIIDYYCVLCQQKIVGAATTDSIAKNNYTKKHRETPECYLKAKQVRITPEHQRVDLTLENFTVEKLFDKIGYTIISDVLDTDTIDQLLAYSCKVTHPYSIFNSSITQINDLDKEKAVLVPGDPNHPTKRFIFSLEPNSRETGVPPKHPRAAELKETRAQLNNTVQNLIKDKLNSSFLKPITSDLCFTALAIIESSPGCEKQAWHRDGIRGSNKYSAVIALESGAHIYVRDFYDPFVSKKVDIPVGAMIFFKSELEHSGGAYSSINRRVHMYFTNQYAKEGSHIFCGDKLLQLIEENELSALEKNKKRAAKAKEQRAAAKLTASTSTSSLPTAPSIPKKKRTKRRRTK